MRSVLERGGVLTGRACFYVAHLERERVLLQYYIHEVLLHCYFVRYKYRADYMRARFRA